jgi:hypothetical protein
MDKRLTPRYAGRVPAPILATKKGVAVAILHAKLLSALDFWVPYPYRLGCCRDAVALISKHKGQVGLCFRDENTPRMTTLSVTFTGGTPPTLEWQLVLPTSTTIAEITTGVHLVNVTKNPLAPMRMTPVECVPQSRGVQVNVSELTYSIVATDQRGNPTAPAYAGSFNVVVASLTVNAAAAPQGVTEALTMAQLAPLFAETQSRFTAALGFQVPAALRGVSIQIAHLPTGILGEAARKTILIDRDAAGYGWFVDQTPADDAEFADLAGTQRSSAAANRADLLTTVMHEMGHVLGYEHSDSLDLMYPTLSLGTRRSPGGQSALSREAWESDGVWGNQLANTSVLDQVFASFQDNGKGKWSMV